MIDLPSIDDASRRLEHAAPSSRLLFVLSSLFSLCGVANASSYEQIKVDEFAESHRFRTALVISVSVRIFLIICDIMSVSVMSAFDHFEMSCPYLHEMSCPNSIIDNQL